MTLKSIFIFALASWMLLSCSSDPLDVNAEDVKVDVSFINMDSAFVHSDSLSFIELHHQWKKEIEAIYNYELGYCLHIGDVSAGETYQSIQRFLQDDYVKDLEKEIAATFTPEVLNTSKAKMVSGLQHLKFHLPSAKYPEHIVFMNSLFASNVFCTEKEIGIGLERYLGESSPSIKALPSREFYDWIKRAMDKRYLERDAMTGWITTHFFDEPSGNLAEQMIHWGKVIYLTEAAFPEVAKSIIMRYNEDDFEWAVKNEFAFWQYLVNEKLLFKTEELNIINMIKEGPFTPGLPEKGPDRLGQYLGWRMVKQYVEDKGISLEKLINTSYNDILQNYEIE